MKFVLCLAVILSLNYRVAYANESVTLSDPDGDYVQIFEHNNDNKLIKAFKEAGYVDQDPMVHSQVIHRKTWCIVKIQNEIKDEVIIGCEQSVKSEMKHSVIKIVNGDYSKITKAVAQLRKKHLHKGINLLTHHQSQSKS